MLLEQNIRFIGEHEMKPAIRTLIGRVAAVAREAGNADPIKGEVLVLLDSSTDCVSESCTGIAAPQSIRLEGNAENAEVFRYSINDMSADITAINVQAHASNMSFELLFGSHMGRVFVGKDLKLTMEPILIVAAAMRAGKMEPAEIIAHLNAILKNTTGIPIINGEYYYR